MPLESDRKASTKDSTYGWYLAFTCYSLALVALVGTKPLWLDEIWQQIGTRHVTFSEMISYARNGPDGAVLPRMLQWLLFRVGDGTVLSRLPALFFGLAGVLCFWRLAHYLNLRYAHLSAFLFMLLPIQIRYSLEARPYSQAMFLVCWAALLLIQLDSRPEIGRTALLTLVLISVLYTQPFALFPVLGMMAALLVKDTRSVSGVFCGLGPLLVSILAYMP